jgi:hypothetical protein
MAGSPSEESVCDFSEAMELTIPDRLIHFEADKLWKKVAVKECDPTIRHVFARRVLRWTSVNKAATEQIVELEADGTQGECYK